MKIKLSRNRITFIYKQSHDWLTKKTKTKNCPTTYWNLGWKKSNSSWLTLKPRYFHTKGHRLNWYVLGSMTTCSLWNFKWMYYPTYFLSLEWCIDKENFFWQTNSINLWHGLIKLVLFPALPLCFFFFFFP